jgi:hypothetical protein
VGAAGVALIEGAARDLEDFNDEIPTAGHSPSWSSPELPDGGPLGRLLAADHRATARRGTAPGGEVGGPMIATLYAPTSTDPATSAP